MRAIMVMYDSLRRDLLPCYGGGIDLPNFRRLAEKTVVFDKSYVCSLPCMPARRELHTGRPNLLHRSWSPIEPFDDSMPELLKEAGIHTHLVSDHFHYTQDGGATYHERYSSWEMFRGQENDKWKYDLSNHGDEFAPSIFGTDRLIGTIRGMRQKGGWQNSANRAPAHGDEALYPQTKTFDGGMEFLETNVNHDNWFLQVETFDPHEPFDVPDSFNVNWFDPDSQSVPDWPPYAPSKETPEFTEQVRRRYYGLMQFCDKSLGRVLDFMDEHDMWKDTMLIVNTDHGFFNGEHDWWGKGPMPDYQELVNTPLFIWDPRSRVSGVHSDALVQTIDLAPTLLEFFNQPIPKDMLGKPLKDAIASSAPVHDYAVFGYYGGAINITDGRYKLMHAVVNPAEQLYEYTQMPTHMNKRFSMEEMRTMELGRPFDFTKGAPTMRIIPDRVLYHDKLKEDLLFDLENDPGETAPIQDEAVRQRLLSALEQQLRLQDAPVEQFIRYGFEA